MIKKWEEIPKQLQELAKNEATLAKKEAQMNEQINRIKEKYAAETKERQYIVDTLRSEIEAFCIKNKSEFDKQRSREFQFGVIGFRISPPKVVLLNRKYNMKTVIELVKRVFSNGYLRIKEELDKETILADYSQQKLDDSKLAAIGLKIDQDETFFVEPKFEELV